VQGEAEGWYEHMRAHAGILCRMTHGAHPRPAELVDSSVASSVAETMQALATPSRLRILGHLHEGPCTVGDLAVAVGMEPSAVSHQLRVLRHLGLVTGQRNGRNVIYDLHDEHVGELLGQAMAHVEHLRLGLAGRRLAPAEVQAA
jgi:ArsR family transcriptional regulator, nickel/cobalt-responsive transcriptional repressor